MEIEIRQRHRQRLRYFHTDGVNEADLEANLLWLVESQYPGFDSSKSKPGLTLAAWAQYMLDNFSTVSETVDALKQEPFTIITANVPGEDRLATVHLSIGCQRRQRDCRIYRRQASDPP